MACHDKLCVSPVVILAISACFDDQSLSICHLCRSQGATGLPVPRYLGTSVRGDSAGTRPAASLSTRGDIIIIGHSLLDPLSGSLLGSILLRSCCFIQRLCESQFDQHCPCTGTGGANFRDIANVTAGIECVVPDPVSGRIFSRLK